MSNNPLDEAKKTLLEARLLLRESLGLPQPVFIKARKIAENLPKAPTSTPVPLFPIRQSIAKVLEAVAESIKAQSQQKKQEKPKEEEKEEQHYYKSPLLRG